MTLEGRVLFWMILIKYYFAYVKVLIQTMRDSESVKGLSRFTSGMVLLQLLRNESLYRLSELKHRRSYKRKKFNELYRI